MKYIYNEGRIAGLSQYELYIRQLMSTNPEATPMTEREWLTSTLANNLSMILKIPAGTTKGIHDYVLPKGSNLTACTQVFGSLFQGQVTLDQSGYWAIRVGDYGDAISNTQYSYPQTPGTPEYVPYKDDPAQENEIILERAAEFLKIREALVIQPGEWTDAVYPPDPGPEPHPGEIVTWDSPLIDSTPVYDNPSDIVLTTEDDVWLEDTRTGTWEEMIEDLEQYRPKPVNAQKCLNPDFHENGFVRILLTEETVNDVYILLHGFVDKIMLDGEVSFPYQSGQSSRPQDGDFLGPSMFPWACPVVLIISTDIEEALIKRQGETDKKFQAAIDQLYQRTMFLGTLHIVTWDVVLTDEYGDFLITENGDTLLANRQGTVAEMWEEEGEAPIVYYLPWWDEYERDIVSQQDEPLLVPKLGTISEMIAEGGTI